MKGEKEMNDITIFNNPKFGELRGIEVNGKPYLVAKDVAEILGYTNPQKAIRDHVDEEDKTVNDSFTVNGTMPILINESGVYSLILSSKLPKAKEFKRWVTAEVLPSIRKHGAYMTEETLEKALANPDFLIQLATQYKEEKEKRLAAEKQIEADRPKVVFADAVEASDGSILVGVLAKILKQNGVEMGQNRLFSWLRENGYLMKGGASRNMPTQYSKEHGLIDVKESTHIMPDGTIRQTFTPKITGKGQRYFVNKFLSKRDACEA